MGVVFVRWQKVVLAAGAVLAAAGGVVYSAIPDATGVINACYDNKGGLRVVDSLTNCKNGETPISWNVQGRQGESGPKGNAGVPGATGASGTPGTNGFSVESLALGAGEDANCLAGGSKFTAANGTTYACNGAASPDDGQVISRVFSITPGMSRTLFEVPDTVRVEYRCGSGVSPDDYLAREDVVNIYGLNPSGVDVSLDDRRQSGGPRADEPNFHNRLLGGSINSQVFSNGEYYPISLGLPDGRLAHLWVTSARRFPTNNFTLEKCHVELTGIMK